MRVDGLTTRRTLFAASGFTAAAFILLAVLVDAGVLSGIDSFATRHLMPWRLPDEEWEFFGPLFSYHGHGFDIRQIVRAPASAAPSAVIVAAGCAYLWIRGSRLVSSLWLTAFLVGAAVEGFCKHVITKPPPEAIRDGAIVELTGFATSFPSGHALRAALIAAVLACCWPRATPFLVAWVIVVGIVTELYTIHTPSDIIGGYLLAGSLICSVFAVAQTVHAPTTAREIARPAARLGS